MATQFYRESAKIYQFPVKAFKRGGDRKGLAAVPTFDEADICVAALDNCWYHDEAVREAAHDMDQDTHG